MGGETTLQGNSPDNYSSPALASSSRSQRARKCTICLLWLTCLAPSVDVRRRPLVFVAVVTQLVTHRLRAPASDPQTAPRVLIGPRMSSDVGDGTHQCTLLACVPRCCTARLRPVQTKIRAS
jgi:hypothetical protein